MGLNESSNFDSTALLWVLLAGSILLNVFLAFWKKPAPMPAEAKSDTPALPVTTEVLPQEPQKAVEPETAGATLDLHQGPSPSEILSLSENEERFASRLAHQVAHDIRSPLAHLLAVSATDDQAIMDAHVREGIRDSANRLREIARQISSPEGLDALLDSVTVAPPLPPAEPIQMVDAPAAAPRVRRSRATPTQKFEDERPEVQLLEPILETLATKAQDRIGRLARVRWWNGNGFGIFVNVSRRKFVSDFLKALDALKSPGTNPISIEVTSPDGKSIEIRVMSSEGGGIEPFRLTSCPAPGWFADQILLPKDCNLIILDDDPSIHRLWAQRLKNLPCHPVHLRDHESAVDWYRSNWTEGQNTFWLCDHELGVDSRTGLETIELLGVQDEALLVTSRFEDPEIQARVIRQGIRILPKLLAPIAPIEWSEEIVNA
jgi:hypothetical protein